MIKNWLRQKIVNIVLEEIEIGGHCGLCGAWVPDFLVCRGWSWTVCNNCAMPSDDKFDELATLAVLDRRQT